MVKKSLLILFLMSLVWACATFKPQPPSFYIEDLPQSITTQMSLEQRIAGERAVVRRGDRARRALVAEVVERLAVSGRMPLRSRNGAAGSSLNAAVNGWNLGGGDTGA